MKKLSVLIAILFFLLFHNSHVFAQYDGDDSGDYIDSNNSNGGNGNCHHSNINTPPSNNPEGLCADPTSCIQLPPGQPPPACTPVAPSCNPNPGALSWCPTGYTCNDDCAYYCTANPGDGINSISGGVCEDVNGNGIGDGGVGHPNVTVTRTAVPGGGTASTTTNSYGNYAFSNVPAGTYSVTINTPAGYSITSSPYPQSVTVPPDNTTVNFCINPPPTIYFPNFQPNYCYTSSIWPNPIQVFARDGSGIQSVTYSLSGQSQRSGSATFSSGDYFAGYWNISILSSSMSVGSYTLSATATDNTGHSSTAGPVSFSFQTTCSNAWIRTFNGDVYSGTNINTPGGP